MRQTLLREELFPLGIVQTNSPESFLLGGRQYAVVAGGDTLYGFYLQYLQ
jgi:hypothetical protein